MKRSDKIEAEALAKLDYVTRVRDAAKSRRMREYYEKMLEIDPDFARLVADRRRARLEPSRWDDAERQGQG